MRPDISWLARERIREELKPFGILFNETREQKMINVLTVHPFDINTNTDDENHWVCYEWPQQFIVVGGVGGPYTTREAVTAAFVEAFNAAKNTNKTLDDFRFFGPMLASATLEQIGEVWTCHAISDRMYSVSAATMEDAKESWLSLYNEEYMMPNNNMTLTEINVDWIITE
jgi:hypothetical protein